jgi:hypothetical protein
MDLQRSAATPVCALAEILDQLRMLEIDLRHCAKTEPSPRFEIGWPLCKQVGTVERQDQPMRDKRNLFAAVGRDVRSHAHQNAVQCVVSAFPAPN